MMSLEGNPTNYTTEGKDAKIDSKSDEYTVVMLRLDRIIERRVEQEMLDEITKGIRESYKAYEEWKKDHNGHIFREY